MKPTWAFSRLLAQPILPANHARKLKCRPVLMASSGIRNDTLLVHCLAAARSARAVLQVAERSAVWLSRQVRMAPRALSTVAQNFCTSAPHASRNYDMLASRAVGSAAGAVWAKDVIDARATKAAAAKVVFRIIGLFTPCRIQAAFPI